MLHSPATQAADDPHGGSDGGGDMHGKSGMTTTEAPPDAAARPAPVSDAPPEPGFVQHLSRKARQKAAKAKARVARELSQVDASPPLPTPLRSQPTQKPKSKPPAASSPAPRPKLEAVDYMIMQLREHAIMRAGVPAIMAVLVQVQHLFRPPGWEKNEKTKAAITRTYEYTTPTDCNSIVSTVTHWFTRGNPIDIATFKAYLRTFEIVQVPAEALPQKRNPWAAPAATGDDEPMANASAAPPQRRRWAKTPRPPTRMEQERLAQVARGKDSSTTLPEFVKETGGVMAAAFLATVVEMQTRGHLVIQLRGVLRVPVTVRQATLLRMVDTKLPGPMSSFVERFKKDVVGARYDANANAIVFTMTTQASAMQFAGELLPVQERLFPLHLLESQTHDASSGGETHVTSLQEYDMQVLNLSGKLWPLNVLHVFHGLLGLEVTSFERAPPDGTGQRDYTLWNITIASHGCPEALVKKTRIVWGEETLWLHHTAVHAHPPCTKCGHVSHPVRVCTHVGPPAQALTLTVEGPQLDVATEVAAAARVDTQEYGCWLLDMESRMLDRSLQAAGRAGTQARKTTQAMANQSPLYFDYALVAAMDPAEIQEKIREQLLGRVMGSAWLVQEHTRKCAQFPRTPPLADLSLADLQDQLAGRMRSVEWRQTREFVVSRAEFRRKVERAEEVLDVVPRIQALQTLAAHKAWRLFEYSYAESTKTAAEIKNDALLALFAKLVRRPATATDDIDARLASVLDKDAMDTADDATNAFHERMTASWKAIRQEEARKAAEQDDAVSAIVADMQDSILAELAAEIMLEEAAQQSDSRGTDAKSKEELASTSTEAPGRTAPGALTSTTADKAAAQAREAAQLREAAQDVARRAAVERASSLRRSLRESLSDARAKRSSSVPPASRAAIQDENYDMEQHAATDNEYAADIDSKHDEWHAHVDEHDVSMESPPPQRLPADNRTTTRGRKPGSCGPYAVSGVQWGRGSAKLEAVGRAKTEAEYLRTGVAGLMHHNYRQLVRRQIIDEARLCRRFLQKDTVTPEDSAFIEDELKRCGMQPCDKIVDEQYWWTSDELRTLAFWLRQPILVFDVNHSGPISAQLHALDLLKSTTAHPEETVTTTPLTHAQAATLLAAYKEARVVPLVLVLDHKARHFSGLRVEEARYDAYAFKARERSKMLTRLRTMLKAQGMYAPPERTKEKLLFTRILTQDEDSSISRYEPSEQDSDESADTSGAPMRGPGVREMVRLAQEATDDSDMEDEEQQTGAGTPAMEEEERKTDTESAEEDTAMYGMIAGSRQPATDNDSALSAADHDGSAPLFQASLVTPTSPLAGAEYIDLAGHISRAGPVPESNEVALKKAQRDNKVAFMEWKKTATHRSPDIKRLLHRISEPAAACDALRDEPRQLIAMLRQLPCVPVLAGRERPTLFAELGKALMIRGRLCALLKYSHQADMTSSGQQFCEEWATSINNCSTNDDRLRLAQLPARWNKLPDFLAAGQHPVRSIADLLDLEWGALLAHLLVSPSVVRDQVQAWNLDEACAALMDWTSHDRRVHHTVLAATAFRNGPASCGGAHQAAAHRGAVERVGIGEAGNTTPVLTRATQSLRRGENTALEPTEPSQLRIEPASPAPARGFLGGLQLVTQNVRGFVKKHSRIADWFSGFRARHLNYQVDAVLLQETRATKEWIHTLTDMHARAWGLDPSKLETPLSHWQATPAASGGVAILLHPLSKLRALRPLWEDAWDSHFMALSGTVDGRTVTVACVYAPTNKKHRERLFRRLSQRQLPGDVVLVGGDFNCVLDEERDRSNTGRTNTDSPELRQVLHAWNLVDAVSADLVQAQSHAEILEFHANAHTFSYRLRDGTKASSRLDRWYISKAAYARVAGTMTAAPVCPTDHDAVFITITDSGTSGHSTRTGRRALTYPLPVYAQSTVDEVSRRHVENLAAQAMVWTAKEAAQQWDGLKTELRRNCLHAKRVAAKKLTNSLRQRARRARTALDNEKRRRLLQETEPTGDAVDTIISRMELLTLDGGDREASLRRQLIVLQHAMATRRHRRAIHQYDGHSAAATRAFFRRMSGRFSRPRVVGGSDRHPTASITAAQLSHDWRPIVQQQPTTVMARTAFFSLLRPSEPRTAEETPPFLDFSEAEVLQAIAACPSGKASGPDGIPNDWYKPVAETLAPAMAKIFSTWVHSGELPPSFREAIIFCLPKVSAPRNGLDFRPISLLNTDYKIFSRLVLQRIQQQVASKVSPAQFGFVAQRQVHDAIDVWDALQARVARGELPATATAVMLDFAKAYDTLDRTFLRQALEYHGFSPLIVGVIDSMHLATTARFLADGDMSETVDIHNGIRQGCPLAPVLFILALDLLYKAADDDVGISGLSLAPDVNVTLSGYADDTTAYLVHPREEPALLRLLAAFGEASGLRINVKKSRAVAIHPQGPTPAHKSMQIPVMRATELLRLLGMAVASKASTTTIWARALQQVRATIHMANVKTTNLMQRVTICTAVIMPKFLFVGRHAWPSGKIFDQLQSFIHKYAWHATTAERSSGSRAWMSAQVATLPVNSGGLGLPDVRTAFLKMSQTTVTRWSASSNPVAAAAGSVLRRLCGGGPAARASGPSRLQQTTTRLQPTLAASGHVALRAARATPRAPEERDALQPLLPATGRGRRDEKWWQDGWLHCRYDAQAATLAHLRRVQSRLYGTFNFPALLAAPAFGDAVLHRDNDAAVVRSDFPGLLEPGMTVGDVLRVEWVQPRHLRFRSRRHAWPLSPMIVDQFRRYCDTLVHNYPALLLPHNEPDELQPRPPSATTWRVRDEDGVRTLVHEQVVNEGVDVGVVKTMVGAAQLARKHEATLVRFDPHPLLDEFAPLWTRRDTTPIHPQASTLDRQARALAEVAGRTRQAINADAVIGNALNMVSWKEVARLPASASRHRLLLHKVKGLRLSRWGPRH